MLVNFIIGRIMKKGFLNLIIFLIIFTIVFFQTSFKPVQMQKSELIYVYDPLCGWCYGFSPVMMKVKERFADQVKVTVISGGMVTGEREGPVKNVAPFIQSAYKQVEQTSGVKFGDPFIKGVLVDGTMHFSSMPPSIALTVFKSFNEEKSLEFAQSIQNMIYYEGKDFNKVESYLELIKPYGINEKEFQNRFKDSIYQSSTFQEFKFSTQLGVTGFPCVFIKHKGKLHVITKGYDSYEKIEKKILSYMN